MTKRSNTWSSQDRKTGRFYSLSKPVFCPINGEYLNEPIRIQNLVKSAKAIARHFDLYPEILNEVLDRIRDRITTYYTEHSDENGNNYYIYQDLDGHNIRIGSDFEILEDWEETKRIFDCE